ncbi:MAG: glycosyltransferase, partial [Acidimicrobiales bacterium]
MSGRVCFVAWGSVPGRSAELASAVGGEARCFFPPRDARPPLALRYLFSAIATVTYLLGRRPRAVIATNPPVFAALVAYGCARALGARFVLDSHPGGFGAQGDRVAARLQGLHRWLATRAAAVLVTEETWARTVAMWGGTALIVHEAPADWDCP